MLVAEASLLLLLLARFMSPSSPPSCIVMCESKINKLSCCCCRRLLAQQIRRFAKVNRLKIRGKNSKTNQQNQLLQTAATCLCQLPRRSRFLQNLLGLSSQRLCDVTIASLSRAYPLARARALSGFVRFKFSPLSKIGILIVRCAHSRD